MLKKDVLRLGQIYQVEYGCFRSGLDIQNKEGWINLGQIYQVELEWIWVGSKKIKLRKDGSGLGQIYQVELGLIKVG